MRNQAQNCPRTPLGRTRNPAQMDDRPLTLSGKLLCPRPEIGSPRARIIGEFSHMVERDTSPKTNPQYLCKLPGLKASRIGGANGTVITRSGRRESGNISMATRAMQCDKGYTTPAGNGTIKCHTTRSSERKPRKERGGDAANRFPAPPLTATHSSLK